ncbi:MAG: hypothetical protein Kapaf2KO_04930 [Candidatus Kapaibacteriales bacterium]
MKAITLTLTIIILSISAYAQPQGTRVDISNDLASPEVIQLTREFSKELFDANGEAWAQPLVKAVNASTNARFFNSAYVPRKVDKPYFRFGVHMTAGFTPENDKWMNPGFPNEPFELDTALQYLSINPFNPDNPISIRDTSGLALYILKTIIYDGLNTEDPENRISVPERAPTLLGEKGNYSISIPPGSLGRLLQQRIAEIEDDIIERSGGLLGEDFEFPPDAAELLTSNIDAVPTFFTLPPGGNINTMVFAVPQIEVGSLFGTELLLRYIPKIDYGETIGEFGFWGVGIKHSISQYFFPADSVRTFDLAIQGAYQASQLDQVFGVTNSEFSAAADIFNVNIHGSMPIKDWFEIYSGFQLEFIDIQSDLKYFIPVEQQMQLGMLPVYNLEDENGDLILDEFGNPVIERGEPTAERPGDLEPQFTDIGLQNTNYKFVIGAYKRIGPVAISLDYNFSQFNLFSLGVQYILD